MAAAISLAGCTVDKVGLPALSGPSGLGLQVVMTATPDRLPRDGSSQSVILLEARDAKGKGLSGQRVTLGVTTGATLSQAEVVTGSDGRASFAVTAPTQSTLISGNVLVVSATPVTTNFDNASTQTITIALTGTTNSTAPSPAFTVTPAAPEVNQLGTFDATTTTDEGGQCLSACTYAWNFDDGVTASGRIATHAFSVAKAYNVTLTVTDASGLVVDLRKVVAISAPAAPTVSIAVSPNPPIVNQQATFTAVAVAAANHSIVRYEWNFGDGVTTTTSAPSATHTYSALGTVAATVRAIDDLGQGAGASVTLILGGGVNADFFFSPTTVHVNQSPPTNFNASASTPSNGATIVKYQWTWGDGSAIEETTDPIITHQFTTANTYTVKLTVVDSQGRIGVKQLPVAVVSP